MMLKETDLLNKEEMKIEMREAKKDDYDELQSLFFAVYNVKPTKEYMHWQFNNNPAGPDVRFIAECNSKIIGQYMLWPTYLQLGEEIIIGAQSIDTIIHPDYQGLGLFTELAEKCIVTAAQRGIEALYGFPNANSYPGFIRRLNWDHVGDIPVWVRPIKLSLHKRIPKIIGYLADIAVIIIPSGKIYPRITVKFSNHIPPEIDINQLLQSQQGQRQCRILRSYNWLKWRFSDDSGLHYEWISVYRNDVLEGYLVWAKKGNNSAGIISDVCARDPFILKNIVSAVIRRAKTKKCSYLTTVTNIPTIIKALRDSGFVRYDKIPLITRKITIRTLGGNIHHFPSWEIMGGDSDSY